MMPPYAGRAGPAPRAPPPPGMPWMAGRQQRRRRGSDFVLEDVVVLDSPNWSDESDDDKNQRGPPAQQQQQQRQQPPPPRVPQTQQQPQQTYGCYPPTQQQRRPPPPQQNVPPTRRQPQYPSPQQQQQRYAPAGYNNNNRGPNGQARGYGQDRNMQNRQQPQQQPQRHQPIPEMDDDDDDEGEDVDLDVEEQYRDEDDDRGPQGHHGGSVFHRSAFNSFGPSLFSGEQDHDEEDDAGDNDGDDDDDAPHENPVRRLVSVYAPSGVSVFEASLLHQPTESVGGRGASKRNLRQMASKRSVRAPRDHSESSPGQLSFFFPNGYNNEDDDGGYDMTTSPAARRASQPATTNFLFEVDEVDGGGHATAAQGRSRRTSADDYAYGDENEDEALRYETEQRDRFRRSVASRRMSRANMEAMGADVDARKSSLYAIGGDGARHASMAFSVFQHEPTPASRSPQQHQQRRSSGNGGAKKKTGFRNRVASRSTNDAAGSDPLLDSALHGMGNTSTRNRRGSSVKVVDPASTSGGLGMLMENDFDDDMGWIFDGGNGGPPKSLLQNHHTSGGGGDSKQRTAATGQRRLSDNNRSPQVPSSSPANHYSSPSSSPGTASSTRRPVVAVASPTTAASPRNGASASPLAGATADFDDDYDLLAYDSMLDAYGAFPSSSPNLHQARRDTQRGHPLAAGTTGSIYDYGRNNSTSYSANGGYDFGLDSPSVGNGKGGTGAQQPTVPAPSERGIAHPAESPAANRESSRADSAEYSMLL